jgi:hypothetical protein
MKEHEYTVTQSAISQHLIRGWRSRTSDENKEKRRVEQIGLMRYELDPDVRNGSCMGRSHLPP